jgi:hypothetical protein
MFGKMQLSYNKSKLKLLMQLFVRSPREPELWRISEFSKLAFILLGAKA